MATPGSFTSGAKIGVGKTLTKADTLGETSPRRNANVNLRGAGKYVPDSEGFPNIPANRNPERR